MTNVTKQIEPTVTLETLLEGVRKHFPSYDLAQYLIQVNCDSMEDVIIKRDNNMIGGLFTHAHHIKGADYWWSATLADGNSDLTEQFNLLQDMVDIYYGIIQYYNSKEPIPSNGF